MNRIYKNLRSKISENILIILLILSEKNLAPFDLPVFKFDGGGTAENCD